MKKNSKIRNEKFENFSKMKFLITSYTWKIKYAPQTFLKRSKKFLTKLFSKRQYFGKWQIYWKNHSLNKKHQIFQKIPLITEKFSIFRFLKKENVSKKYRKCNLEKNLIFEILRNEIFQKISLMFSKKSFENKIENQKNMKN